jgi:hypothetical protein
MARVVKIRVMDMPTLAAEADSTRECRTGVEDIRKMQVSHCASFVEASEAAPVYPWEDFLNSLESGAIIEHE